MKNRILMFAGIAVLVAGLAAFAVGRGFPRLHGQGRGDGMKPRIDMVEHIARELNLTDGQKEQVKAIIDSVRSAEEARHVKLDELHQQIEAATANGQFDEAQVRALASQQAQLMADGMVEHIRAHSKIYALLTAEQRAKADELHKFEGQRMRKPWPPEGPRKGPPPPPPSE